MVKCNHVWEPDWVEPDPFSTTCFKKCMNDGCAAVMMGCAGTETGIIKRLLIKEEKVTDYNGKPVDITVSCIDFVDYEGA